MIEDLRKLCETDFQNGHGRAQIRDSSNFKLLRNFETRKIAKYFCSENEIVCFRQKVRLERRYEWVIVPTNKA